MIRAIHRFYLNITIHNKSTLTKRDAIRLAFGDLWEFDVRPKLYPIIRWYLYSKRINDRTIPTDEFDPSLDMDLGLILNLKAVDQEIYLKNLEYRRYESHIQDMKTRK
jgi:hypothetical protein